MPFTPTALKQARDAGYKDEEIVSFLSASDERIPKAVEAGYGLDEIATFLGEKNNKGPQIAARIGAGLERAAGEAIAGVAQGAGYVPMVANTAALLESYGLGNIVQGVKDVGRGLAAGSEADYSVDPTQNQRLSSKVIQAASSVVPVLASGPLAPVTAAAQAGESGRAEAQAAGGTQQQQDIAFGGNAAVGAITEYFLGLPAIFRSIQATGLPQASVKAIVAQTAKQIVKGGVREGVQEGLQQGASNLIASDIAQYEKDRPLMQGVIESAALGALIGGGLSGTLSVASVPEQLKQVRESLKPVSDTSLKAALADEDLLAGSPYSKAMIEGELLARDPGYKAEAAGAPLTAEALRSTPETPVSEQQPAKTGGDNREVSEPIPNPARPIEDRDEQRQGVRPGDQRNREGLQPDEGNATGNRSVPEDRQAVEGGQRDQLSPEAAKGEPQPAPASKGAAVPEGPLTAAEQNELSELVAVGGNSDEVQARRQELWDRQDKYGTEQAPKRGAEQAKLDELISMLPTKPSKRTEMPASASEGKKGSDALAKLQKAASDKRSELNAARSAAKFDDDAKAEIPGLERELKVIQRAIERASAPESKASAPSTRGKKAPSAPEESQPERVASPSVEQSVEQKVADYERQIASILKERKLSSSDAERTALWEKAQALDEKITKLKGDWTQATEEPSPEIKKAADEDGLELYSGLPLPKFALRRFTPLDKATASRSAKLQKSEQEATSAVKEIRKIAPTPAQQSAITVYAEAGGDHGTLSKWHLNAKNKSFKNAALDAMNLSPEQEALAKKVRTAFDDLATRAQAHDVLGSFRDNYVPHVWDLASRKAGGSSSSALQQNFRFAKARTFATIAEGDAAGFTPKTLEIGKLLPAYMAEMNKVIADRQFVEELSRGKASDGRPLVIPRGTVKTQETDDGTAYLVNPRSQTSAKDTEGQQVEQRDYRVMEGQPALANWKWKGKDEAGNPIFMRGDLALHPDAFRRVTAMLGKSALREWAASPSSDFASPIPKAIVRGLDKSQAVLKREMFSLLAPFHQVQEGTHAVGHLVNPFFGLSKADLSNPAVFDAAAHGLMLQPDRGASQQFMEGIGGESSFTSQALSKLGPAGRFVAQEVIDGYQSYLFKSYIPRLKYTTYEKILTRNSKRYSAELKSGEVTTDDIKLLSAEQTNAAYGHLNYALLDRNPTNQHLIQLAALAPDFLEARGRFVAQGLKGLLGSKTGNEQLKAVVVLALAQSGMAWTLAQVTGGKWDKEHPFEMSIGDRRYTMRSVPEDLFKLITEVHDYAKGKTQGVPFVSARINPSLQTLQQLVTGLNYRGEKTDLKDTLGEYLAKYIPITARALPGVRDLTETSRNNPVTPLQQLAGSFGLKISRYSPIQDAYKFAAEWKREQGIEPDKGSYPVSKYLPLRYALEDGDLEKAREAYTELRKKQSAAEIEKGFRASVTHPFTGKREDDRKLHQSLSPEDRLIFEEAVRARIRILHAFGAMRSKP